MHLQHGQACNNEKQDDGCGGPAAIVEILVKGVIDENPLCGGCPRWGLRMRTYRERPAAAWW